ncbi:MULTISPECIES: hypothetical protein [Streptomyces]|uniref:Uncharacterized protein n=2 Tax=Streptomyces bottropensis TaxID=42235 RepID=M3D940_9ACTN|nr:MULTISPECIES: hypothetical protein [Streptomyces]EMF52782.1 hypothetical protein SBD_5858 [Streptomyces bottropensis ATCC 25435]MZD21859.1 hypothetical protein [Streptomyces sp. SID5476]
MIHGVQDGEGFRIAPDAHRWITNRLECERFEEDHFFHNPYGYWRLTPGWTRAPNAGGVMDRGGTGRDRAGEGGGGAKISGPRAEPRAPLRRLSTDRGPALPGDRTRHEGPEGHMTKRTPTRPGTTVAVAVAVLALGGLQGSTADAQTVEAVSSPSTTCHGAQPKGGSTGHSGDGVPEDDTPLYRTLDHVDKLVTGRYAAHYTGLVLAEDEVSLDIYRIPSQPFDTAVCDAAEKGVTVRLHDRDINERDLNALLDRVSEDMTRWDGTFDLREVGLDGTGRVQIGVDDPGKAEPILRKAYGDHNAKHLVVEYAPQAHLL